MNLQAKWIIPSRKTDHGLPVYRKTFPRDGAAKATLRLTALGIYVTTLNGKRIGDAFLRPGFTSYRTRLQVQEYDVTNLLEEVNVLEITVGNGWYHSETLRLWAVPAWRQELMDRPLAAIAELTLEKPGKSSVIGTDGTWQWAGSEVRFSSIYGGEVKNALWKPEFSPVALYDGPDESLIPEEGPAVKAVEYRKPEAVLHTPKGETVLDFGQNLAGTIEFSLCARSGELLDVSFGEVLDKDGNFFNENYRNAECLCRYVCRDGVQVYRPEFTFYGYRYVRINAFPGGFTDGDRDRVRAVVLHSEMKRTGYLSTSDPILNRFAENVIWGQKSNFIDIPTDCPQRDERAGWTGDAMVFARTACLNYDAERFFRKWLADLRADQGENGFMPTIVPDVRSRRFSSPGWGDASTIVPWQVYLAYGDPSILSDQFESMKKWVDFITADTLEKDLWIDELLPGERHYGDWVALDAPDGSYKGSTRDSVIGSAFYAKSTELVVKAGRIIGKDVSEYEALHERIVKRFREKFPEYKTQTECILALEFGLASDPETVTKQLVRMVEECGGKLVTGFLGTPYILHVLTDHGHADLAWDLMLRTGYPSWLYQVTKGATTVWEHLDGLKPDGTMWSSDMNSFNHYAYGSAIDWLYTKAAGIQTVENAPGYRKVRIEPNPTARLEFLEASVDTRSGLVRSGWKKDGAKWIYHVEVPVEAEIVIDGKSETVPAGVYRYTSDVRK